MAANSIPEEIRQYRPSPCTEIKLINGHYYVYMYQSVRLLRRGDAVHAFSCMIFSFQKRTKFAFELCSLYPLPAKAYIDRIISFALR